MFPIFLAILVMAGIGTYAVMFAYELAPLNLTHVVLTMYILFTVVITLIEGIYKTQGILFDAKDSDLLFSLPIKKSTIFDPSAPNSSGYSSSNSLMHSSGM